MGRRLDALPRLVATALSRARACAPQVRVVIARFTGDAPGFWVRVGEGGDTRAMLFATANGRVRSRR